MRRSTPASSASCASRTTSGLPARKFGYEIMPDLHSLILCPPPLTVFITCNRT